MKKILAAAILGLTGLAGAAGADAHDGPYRHENRRPAHHRRYFREPRVWVPARYETRIVGYECGRPITRVVLVTPGYWTSSPDCR